MGARVLAAWHVVLVVTAVVIAALTSHSSDWNAELMVILTGLAILSTLFSLEVKGIKANAAFLSLVLAMALLGPAPAVAIGISTMLVNSVQRRLGWRALLANLACYATFCLAGALALRAAAAVAWVDETAFGFAVAVFAVYLGANFFNFLLIAFDFWAERGESIGQNVRKVYLPLVPVEISSALLTAGAAYSYQRLGMGVIVLLAVAGLVFQYLLHLALQSMKRGEQLQERTEQLASLQVGLLTTVLNTLSLRDKMTARHSAAVARYAREIARELGMSERDQDIVHTAGLLHDIGKFVFPDDILLADTRLTDEQYELVKTHPARGAELVEKIEGYGPVAEIIRSHHERIDGRGYPDGLIADEIPLASRIIAVCDTYDVMTARDSYQKPVTRNEAIAELKRVAGSQLDARIVDTFVRLMRERNIVFRHTDDADFEQELNFEVRVRDYARPREAVAKG